MGEKSQADDNDWYMVSPAAADAQSSFLCCFVLLCFALRIEHPSVNPPPSALVPITEQV